MNTKNTLFYSRCLMAAIAVLGPSMQMALYGIGMLTYYTTLSNILVAIFSVYMVAAMSKGRDLQETSFLRKKGMVTMSIMITFVIYHFMLRPYITDFWRVENIICHYITPLYFFLDTLLVDKIRQYKWWDALVWTAVPLVYLAFALVNGLVLHIPIPNGTDGYFAYFFLNGPKFGWTYVLVSCVTIFVFYLLGGLVLIAVKSLRFPKICSRVAD